MNIQDKRTLFEHYCASQTSFHHTPAFTDYSAGYDAGIAHMQHEINALKQQIVTFRYGQKVTDDAGNRIATLESLNRALIHALSEINEGK